MKTATAIMLLALIGAPRAATAQFSNCSSATMTPAGQSYACNVPTAPGNPQPLTPYPASGSATYTDNCINTATDATYGSFSSTVMGNGQCELDRSAQWHNCPFVNTTTITLAQSIGDYNRMYNYAYDVTISGGVTGTSFTCPRTGAWRQDMQQCGPIPCPTVGNNCQPPPNGCPSGQSWVPWPNCWCQIMTSPILVDTTGKGFHLTPASDGVAFDIWGTGHPVKLAWTAADSGNAFLALDRNHNGMIDGGKELFGNITEQPSSNNPNGYLALAEFDKTENGGNGDGIIDWRDAVYSQLRLWIDANHDGISQPAELHTLPELGVFSIGLKYQEEHRTDQYGNVFRYRGALNPNPADGTSKDGRYTYDVFLALMSTQAASASCQTKTANGDLKADHELK